MICLVRSLYFLFYLFVLKMCLYYGMVANEIFLSASKGSVHGKFSSLQHQSFLLMSIIFIACNQTMYRLFQYSCSQASFLNLWLVLFRMMQHIATSYSSFSLSYLHDHRDGRMPVSFIQKYLAKKLNLTSETEVSSSFFLGNKSHEKFPFPN